MATSALHAYCSTCHVRLPKSQQGLSALHGRPEAVKQRRIKLA